MFSSGVIITTSRSDPSISKALAEITGLPVVLMPFNDYGYVKGSISDASAKALATLVHNSVVYIADTNIFQRSGFAIEEYYRLIIENTPYLTEGMMLNIVLWNSFAGLGVGSPASELGARFAKNKIATNILASQGIVGSCPDLREGQESVAFQTPADQVRLFAHAPSQESKVVIIKHPVSFTAQGFEPDLSAYLLPPKPRVLTEDLKTSAAYKGAMDRVKAEGTLKSAREGTYLLRDSSIKHADNTIFCLSKSDDKKVITHHLFVITPANELYSANAKGMPNLANKLVFLPGESLTEAIERTYKLTNHAVESTASSSTTAAASSSSATFFSLPGTKLLSSTIQSLDVYPDGYTKTVAKSFETGERESRLGQLIKLVLDHCVEHFNNVSISKIPESVGNRKEYFKMQMSPEVSRAMANLQNKELTGQRQHWRIHGFIQFIEMRASHFSVKWTIADRLFRVNMLSALLGKEVLESTLNQSINELKTKWDLPVASSSGMSDGPR